MYLTEQQIIPQDSDLWKIADELTFLSKNLYNATLYDVRQYYFEHKRYKTYETQKPEFVRDNNPDFRALPANVAVSTMQLVHDAFSSFFSLWEKKQAGEYDSPVNIPGYKDKDGRQVLTFPKNTISKKPKKLDNGLFEHTLSPQKLKIKITSTHKKVINVRIVPNGNHYLLDIVYEIDDPELLPNNGRAASLDPGVTNFATLAFNTGAAPLIYGGWLKSINQYYNKTLAKKKSELPKGVKTSKAIKSLTVKRNRKIKFEMHCISTDIVNHLVSENVTTLVIGHNKGWKQDANLGKRNNQNFVMLPHSEFFEMLKYKCKLAGINVIMTEESYTSQTSFLDGEKPVKSRGIDARRDKKLSPFNRRKHRGLFVADNKKQIHADVNSALQIMKKAVAKAGLPALAIEGVTIHPVRVTILAGNQVGISEEAQHQKNPKDST